MWWTRGVRALTEPEIRSAFVNASRREAAQAAMPDLDVIDWPAQDVLGWRDPKRPLLAYVVLEDDDGEPRAVMLRPAAEAAGAPRRRKVCSLDVEEVARRLLRAARGGALPGQGGRDAGGAGLLVAAARRRAAAAVPGLPRARARR